GHRPRRPPGGPGGRREPPRPAEAPRGDPARRTRTGSLDRARRERPDGHRRADRAVAGRRRRAVPGGHRRRADRAPDHRARTARGRVPRVLRRGRHGNRCTGRGGLVNGALLAFTWRQQRVKLLVVAVALALFGMLLVVVYAAFGRDLRAVLESGLIP